MLGLFLGGLASALGTIGSQAMANKRAEQDRAMNFWYNEQAAAAADARTRKLYQDLQSPEALLEQYRKAGLSPSLMLGNGGGISGQVSQGAQGGGTSGLQTQMYGFNPLDAAQVELAHAQAEKLRAETSTELGQNDRGAGEIAKIWAEAGATEASELYTKAMTSYQKIQNRIAGATEEFSIARIKHETQIAAENATRAFWEAEDAGLQFHYNQAVFESNVERAANEAALLAEKIALTQAQTRLTDEEKNAIKDYVRQGYAQIGIGIMNAAQYGEYVEAFADNLPKQLELRNKELGVEKWRIGVGAFTELIRTLGYIAGASQLGEGGYQTDETITEYDKHGNAKGTTKRNTSRTNIPKRIR